MLDVPSLPNRVAVLNCHTVTVNSVVDRLDTVWDDTNAEYASPFSVDDNAGQRDRQ